MGDFNWWLVLCKYVSFIERFVSSYKRIGMLEFTDCQSQLVFNHFISATVCQTTQSLNPDAGVALEEDQSVETCQINQMTTTDHVLYSLFSAQDSFIPTTLSMRQSLLAKLKHSTTFHSARLSLDRLTWTWNEIQNGKWDSSIFPIYFCPPKWTIL